MDHRAAAEADFINRLDHDVLKFVGGKMSPEMEPPKLMWLKKYNNDTFSRAKHFFDLADFCTYKATGVPVRSICTVTCKWTYQVAQDSNPPTNAQYSAAGWDKSFFNQIGLEEFVEEKFARIGTCIAPLGTGHVISTQAAAELGLASHTIVATGIIDAHSGGISMIGGSTVSEADGTVAGSPDNEPSLSNRLCVIAGTSTCHMYVSETQKFVPGVWGPYFGAMIPNLHLLEGGQSASGRMMDFIIDSHIGCKSLELYRDRHRILEERIVTLAKARSISNPTLLTPHMHLVGDFYGNRSPLADPTPNGMWMGLELVDMKDETAVRNDLTLRYLCGLQSLAFGTRHIIDSLPSPVDSIFMCGSMALNNLFVQIVADVCNAPVYISDQSHPVAAGAAMLAAAGVSSASLDRERIAGAESTTAVLLQVMKQMTRIRRCIYPDPDSAVHSFHTAKYKVYRSMLELSQCSRLEMQ
jgi:D-ribulokinase